MTRLRTLLRNERGTATIEFALVSLFLFGTMMVALDFGFYTQQKLRLGSAVEQGAILGYNTQVASAAAATNIGTYVSTYAGTKNTPNVGVTCNGGTANSAVCGDGKCSCVTSGGAFTIVASCNAACSGSNAISGNYMKITATAVYPATIVPDRYLGGGNIVQSAVVRLQ